MQLIPPFRKQREGIGAPGETMGSTATADALRPHNIWIKGDTAMPVVSPLAEEKAPDELKPIYEGMKKKFGRMPNFFGVMANKPDVLKNFLPFYSAITGPGALEQRYKELAYLKTSINNGCEY
jgi:alkylhydroperoxidase/carboxymuconolactone decarboxylase family protein YurZ